MRKYCAGSLENYIYVYITSSRLNCMKLDHINFLIFSDTNWAVWNNSQNRVSCPDQLYL